MANNELAIRFTEEQYASKNEVARELKMSLIDTIWSNILSYRSNFNHYLSIKSVNNSRLVLCLCPTLSSGINTIEAKLTKAIKQKNNLNEVNGDARYYKLLAKLNCLEHINKKYQLNLNETSLKKIINGKVEADDSKKPLISYLKGLNFIENNYADEINLDFIVNLYQTLGGRLIDGNIFRTEEHDSRESHVMISRVYNSAPSNFIEQMMISLFEFIKTNGISPISKALVSYYYLSYIKPFDEYNDEIALLTAKAIISHAFLDDIGVYLPIEEFISEKEEETNRHFADVNKTSDVTYFVFYGQRVLDEKCNVVNDSLIDFSSSIIKKEFYVEDEKPIEKEEIKEEKPADVVEKNVEQPVIKPHHRPVVSEAKVNNPAPAISKPTIAISNIPEALDEKQAARLEEHLLELEPLMKKGEAKFYSRHCTLGMMYTIQQYKRSIGCVYETARTSMEHLVLLGYYQKKQIKNKFVYTPIARK